MPVIPFKTAANERSFSALVDRAITETGKPSTLLTVIQYANATIRECQALGLFARDMVEDQAVSDAQPFIWARPRRFRSFRSIQYNTSKLYPKFRVPGRNKDLQFPAYFYAADNYYAFNGMLVGESLNYAAYFWAKPMLYYGQFGLDTTNFPGGPYVVRKAYYDIELDQWMYLNLAGTAYIATYLNNVPVEDTTEEALRRLNALNWLVDDWWDTVLEGVKAKVFKQYNDDRAPASYSLYKQMQKVLQNTAGFEVESFMNVE